MIMNLGSLVFYDRFGGDRRSVFPFGDPQAVGIGLIVSEIKIQPLEVEDYQWVWIIDEEGNRVSYALDYLEPVVD
jgi:hypothetical protein